MVVLKAASPNPEATRDRELPGNRKTVLTLFNITCSEAIVVLRFDIRHFVQRCKESFAGSAGSTLLQPFPSSQLFHKRRSEDLVDRHVLGLGDLNRLLV